MLTLEALLKRRREEVDDGVGHAGVAAAHGCDLQAREAAVSQKPKLDEELR